MRPIRRWISTRAAALLAGRGLAPRALGGGARQHAVFGRDPAAALALEPGRQPVLQRGGDQHMGVAELHEAGAFGIFHHAALERSPARISSGCRRLGRMRVSLSCGVVLVASRFGGGPLRRPTRAPRLHCRRTDGQFWQLIGGAHAMASGRPDRHDRSDARAARRALARDFPPDRRELSGDRRAGRLAQPRRASSRCRCRPPRCAT